MKKLVYLAAAALVALMLSVPVASAQMTIEKTKEKTIEKTAPLPPSGGLAASSMLLPAAALIVGSGILAYSVLRRRQ